MCTGYTCHGDTHVTVTYDEENLGTRLRQPRCQYEVKFAVFLASLQLTFVALQLAS